MLIKDSYDDALKISESANLFLAEHVIPPSPVNYSVIYLFKSKRNKKLSAELDKHLYENKTVDLFFIETLYNKYISNTQNISNKILEPIEQSLTKTLAKINAQVDNEKTIKTNLQKAEKALNKQEYNKSLQNIVTFLMSNIEQSQQQHNQLSTELTNTCGEVNFLKTQLEKARYEAIVDALTGLFNRRGCDEKLQHLDIEKVHSSLAIDIDHFKNINDKFGHFIGDKVIQRISSVIKAKITDDDIAVRFGGEEFVVVMVNKTLAQAYDIAEQIRIAISELKLVQKNSKEYLPQITVSIGVTQRKDEVNWQDVFEQADTALYQAKSTGRNKSICM